MAAGSAGSSFRNAAAIALLWHADFKRQNIFGKLQIKENKGGRQVLPKMPNGGQNPGVRDCPDLKYPEGRETMNFILRKTTAVLAALAMLVLSAAIPLSAYADTDGYGEIVFETDFENGLGVNNKDLQWKSDGGARTPVEMLSPVDEEEHGKIVGVPTMGSNGKRDHFLRTSYAKVNGKFESAMLTGEALERVQHIRLGMDIMMGDYAGCRL